MTIHQSIKSSAGGETQGHEIPLFYPLLENNTSRLIRHFGLIKAISVLGSTHAEQLHAQAELGTGKVCHQRIPPPVYISCM
jgi:hypothetical protein